MDLPEHRHGFTGLTGDSPWRHHQPIVYTLHIDPALSSSPNSRDIPPKLVDLVFDIGEYMRRLQLGKDLGNQPSRDGKPPVVGHDMHRDIEFFQLSLLVRPLLPFCVGVENLP